jgi:hypothetical protein
VKEQTAAARAPWPPPLLPPPAGIAPAPAPAKLARGAAELSQIVGTLTCVGVFTLLLVTGLNASHWCMVPILLCGLLITPDAVRWFTGAYDLLDARGLIGVLGLHHFFLAPLLHLRWDFWIPYTPRPDDWQESLGVMAVLNTVGLLCYFATRHLVLSRRPRAAAKRTWVPRAGRVCLVGPAMIAVGMVIQGLVLMRFGGLSGFVDAATNSRDQFEGLGVITLVGESFPLIGLLTFVCLCRTLGHRPGWPVLAAVLLIAVVFQTLMGGARGSRADVVYILFWGSGVVHLCLRRVPRSMALGGLAFLVVFAYAFTFYKFGGLEGLSTLGNADLRSTTSIYGGRAVEGVILSDLSRANIQAHLLSRLRDENGMERYALGRTYLGAVALLIPRSIWPERPAGKVQEGTELIYGEGAFNASIYYYGVIS